MGLDHLLEQQALALVDVHERNCRSGRQGVRTSTRRPTESPPFGDAGTGRVAITEREDQYGRVPREDVAAVIAASVAAPNTIGKTFVLLEGETPIDDAIAAL